MSWLKLLNLMSGPRCRKCGKYLELIHKCGWTTHHKCDCCNTVESTYAGDSMGGSHDVNETMHYDNWLKTYYGKKYKEKR